MSNNCLLTAKLNTPEITIKNRVTLAFMNTHKSLSYINTEKPNSR